MLFKSYLSDRSQQCQVNGELSTLKYLKYGVPQGSINFGSTSVFNLYQ